MLNHDHDELFNLLYTQCSVNYTTPYMSPRLDTIQNQILLLDGSLNVGALPCPSNVLDEHPNEESSLFWVGHPQDRAYVSRGSIVTAEGEPISNMQRLVGLAPKVAHQGLKPQGFIPTVDKNIIATIEGTEGHLGLELVLD